MKLTTTKGIYNVLKDHAPADIWEWAEAHIKHWKVQVRWTFDMDEAPARALCYFAGLISSAATISTLTSKRRAALTNLYNQIRIEAALGDEMLPLIEAFKCRVCEGGHLPPLVDPDDVSADLSDADFFGLDEEPSAAECAKAQDIMQGELVASLEALEAPQEPPATPKVKAVADKLAALQAAPEAPSKPVRAAFEVPPAERRAHYLLAELFRSMEGDGA